MIDTLSTIQLVTTISTATNKMVTFKMFFTNNERYFNKVKVLIRKAQCEKFRIMKILAVKMTIFSAK